MTATQRSAHSLLELGFALLLLSVLIGLAAPPLRRALAWARARSARDQVAMQAARARALAVARGGAELVLDLAGARAWIEAEDTVLPPVSFANPSLLTASASGSAGDTVRIGWDALGVGRLASRTLRFRVGPAEAGLTISAYGRVRVW